MFKYFKDSIQSQRLLTRKVKRWIDLKYLPEDLGKKLIEEYSDGRWSVNPVIRPILFMATTLVLVGTSYLFIGKEFSAISFLIIAIPIFTLYEFLIGKKFYKAGIDDSFILVGIISLIGSILLLQSNAETESSHYRFLLCSFISCLAGIRYQNYLAYCLSFLLLQLFLINFFEEIGLNYILFIFASVLTAFIAWVFFYLQRINGPAFRYQWYRTLEIFFLTMVTVALNPYYQDWLYGQFIAHDKHYFSTGGFFVQIFINLGFAILLIIWGIRERNRVPLILAFSSIFTIFLSVWDFYGEQWPEDIVLTISGAIIFGFGIIINQVFKNPRWNIVANKIEYQKEKIKVLDDMTKIRKNIKLKK